MRLGCSFPRRHSGGGSIRRVHIRRVGAIGRATSRPSVLFTCPLFGGSSPVFGSHASSLVSRCGSSFCTRHRPGFVTRSRSPFVTGSSSGFVRRRVARFVAGSSTSFVARSTPPVVPRSLSRSNCSGMQKHCASSTATGRRALLCGRRCHTDSTGSHTSLVSRSGSIRSHEWSLTTRCIRLKNKN